MQFSEQTAQYYFSIFGISLLYINFRVVGDELPRLLIADCNEVFLKSFGLTREAVIARPLSTLLEEGSYNQSLQCLYMSMKLEKPGTVLLPLKDGEGRSRRMEIAFFPFPDIQPVENVSETLWCWVMRPAPGSTP